MNKVLVTVCMTAYNQAKYLVDAIESILMQKTDFQFELLIGEDLSNRDSTLEICGEYEMKYPHIVRIIHDGKNHGMVANEQRLMAAAKGKYIAFCEADDYWIDPLKLQKQVDVLEANNQFSACACQSRVICGMDKENWCLLSNKSTSDREITLQDLLNGDLPFQTASFLFRSKHIHQVDPMPLKINGWDRAVFLLNAYRGNIYWFKEPMAVYRKNEGGISTWVTFELMKRDLDMINWFKSIDEKFPINALKAHIYQSMIANAITIKTSQIIIYYFFTLFYSNRSEIEMTVLKASANKTLSYRLPKNLRRVFRKLGFIKSYVQ